MRAGKLDRTITIETAITSIDANGVAQTTWAAIGTARAEVLQASTSEFIRQHGASSEATIVFRTRYLAGVNVDDRIVFENRALNIVEVKEIGRRRGLELRTIARGAP